MSDSPIPRLQTFLDQLTSRLSPDDIDVITHRLIAAASRKELLDFALDQLRVNQALIEALVAVAAAREDRFEKLTQAITEVDHAGRTLTGFTERVFMADGDSA